MLRCTALAVIALLSHAGAVQLTERHDTLAPPSSLDDTQNASFLDEMEAEGGGPRRRAAVQNRRRTSSERDPPVQPIDCILHNKPLSVKEVCGMPGGGDGGGNGGNNDNNYTPRRRRAYTPRRRRAKNVTPRRRRAKNGGGYQGGNQAVPRRRRAKNGGGGAYAGGGAAAQPRRRRAKNAGGGGGYAGGGLLSVGGGVVSATAIGGGGGTAGGGYAGGAATPRRRRAKNGGGGGGYAGGGYTPRRRRAKGTPRRRRGGGGGDYDDGCKTAVYSYDAATGKEKKLYDAPTNEELKKCAVSPIDDKIYCTTKEYVVRMDSTKMRYVAKLASYSNAVTFSDDGTFYYEGQGYNGLFKVPTGKYDDKLDSLPDYENKDDTIKDYSDDDQVADTLEGAQDLLAVKADFGEGTKEYLVVLNVMWQVIVVDIETDKVTTIESVDGDKEGIAMGFSKGWGLQNRIFFSEDTGLGTYEVKNVNIKAKTATVEKKEPSETASKASGLACKIAIIPPKWARSPRSGPPVTPAPPAAPGRCINQNFIHKNPCGCSSTTRCQRCSIKTHCSGKASAVIANADQTACECTCSAGAGGPDCSS